MYTKTEKRVYCTPQIDKIKLDNEISLVLMSDPDEPGLSSISPEYFNNDPFKTNHC